MQHVTGRVAVVTGAASGMGRSMARRFAREGMRVVLADVTEVALAGAVDEIQATGAEAIGVLCDVSNYADVEGLLAATLEAFGEVSLLCNNAGIDPGAPFSDFAAGDWNRVFQVNALGVLNGMRVFLPALRKSPEAHIVNTASIAALNGYLPTGTAYVASKMGVLGLTENLFHEFEGTGETVGLSVLCPGFVDTGMSARPVDAAAAAAVHPARQRFIDATVKRSTEAGIVGLSPDVVADQVLDAIRTNRFYILPHYDEARDAVLQRLRWMTDNIPPSAPPGVASADTLAEPDRQPGTLSTAPLSAATLSAATLSSAPIGRS